MINIPRMINLNSKIQSKTIRVFLSSTFTDMQEEREYLINVVFPYLRSLARKVNVEFTEIDLRWGITDEEAENGEVMSLCLNEIGICKQKSNELPFFIGLIGARYGWQPTNDDINPCVFDEIDLIHEYVQKKLSVTEIEMNYAILDHVSNNPQLLTQSFFYFRNIRYTKNLQSANPEIVYVDEDENTSLKLSNLKNRIVELGNEPFEYVNKEDLGKKVISDFECFLDKYFGKPGEEEAEINKLSNIKVKSNKQIKQLKEEQRRQAIFAQTRTKFYVERSGSFSHLNQLLQAHKQVVITAEVGMGKTSLLANYIAFLQRSENAEQILYHFCGATLHSDNLLQMLRRLIAELQYLSGKTIELPKKEEDLANEFISELSSLPKNKKVILVIDALDQLDFIDNLSWLPNKYPENVNIIVSVKSPIEGDSHPVVEGLIARDFITVNIEPLLIIEREKIIKERLVAFGRKLPNDLLNKVANYEVSRNPLVLLTLIEEMRVLGKHESLEEDIIDYISVDTCERFFARVLERVVRDFPFAKDVISHIGSSRMGLSEIELSRLLNAGNNRHMTNLQWSSLYEILGAHLKDQDGSLTWFHDIIKNAVDNKFLYNKYLINKYRELQIRYFENDVESDRGLINLPWLYNQCEKWKELGLFLGNSDRFLKFYDEYGINSELKLYIYNLRGNFDFYGCIRKDIEEEKDDERRALKYYIVASFHYSINEYSKSVTLFALAKRIYQELVIGKSEFNDRLCSTLNSLGCIYEDLFDFDKAVEEHSKSINILSQLSIDDPEQYKPILAQSLVNLGNIYRSLGDIEESLKLYLDALKIFKDLAKNDSEKYDYFTANLYSTLGLIYGEGCDFSKAIDVVDLAIDIHSGLALTNQGVIPDLARAYFNKGWIYKDMRRYKNALSEYTKALKIFRELAEVIPEEHLDNVGKTLNDLGLIYLEIREYQSAYDCLYECVDIYKALSDDKSLAFRDDLARAFFNFSLVNLNISNYKESIEIANKALFVYEELAKNNNFFDEDVISTRRLINQAVQDLNNDEKETLHLSGDVNLELDRLFYQEEYLRIVSIIDEKGKLDGDEINMKGVCYLRLGMYEKAKDIFYEITKIHDNLRWNENVTIVYICNLLVTLILLKRFDAYEYIISNLSDEDLNDVKIQSIILSYEKWKEKISEEVSKVSIFRRNKERRRLENQENIQFDFEIGGLQR